MSVGQICERWVDVAAPHETMQQAAERMHQRTVGALVVVAEGNIPVGMVTDRDLVVRGIAHHRDANATLVRDIMSLPVKTVLEDTPVEGALTIMRRANCRRLPVVNRAEALVGIISLDDILLHLAKEFASVQGLVQSETPRCAAHVDA